MKIDLFEKPEYDFIWPLVEDYPREEKVVLKCRRLSHNARRRIEDNMIRMSPSDMERNHRGVSGSSMTMAVGTIKELKLRDSVYDWENVFDPKGNSYKFSFDKLTELIACNGGLDSEQYGHLELELINEINRVNNFADQERPREGNSPTGSANS
jgi:hypothetical protein